MSSFNKNDNANLGRALLALSLDHQDKQKLQTQLLRLLKDLLTNSDYAGARLPSSRLLAQELSVSRTTVQIVYEQLISEGYLAARQGSGTFIAEELPHLRTPSRGSTTNAPAPQQWQPFEIGLPDQSLFPHRSWARHLEQAWRRSDPRLHGRADPFGYYPLRQAICEHLEAWRDLNCEPSQIVITCGAGESLDLVFRGILRGAGDVAIEDPCWPRVYDMLATCGLTGRPARIDHEGLNPEQISPGAGAVLVTPSRHYPTGISMPLGRRLALIEWANATGGIVIEDDYDSEFRYRGKPLPSLAGLDQLHNTIYLGSFSKLISPSIRIAYMVLPKRHIGTAEAYLLRNGGRASLVPQPALASFLSSGEFSVHLRRARRIYAKRQRHLIASLMPLDDILRIEPDASGMHLCLPLVRPDRAPDAALAGIARAAGISIDALSDYAKLPNSPQALLLGYAAFNEQSLNDAAEKLVKTLKTHRVY